MLSHVKIRWRRLALAVVGVGSLIASTYLAGPLYQSPFPFEVTDTGQTPEALSEAQALPAATWHHKDLRFAGSGSFLGETSVWFRASIPAGQPAQKWVVGFFGAGYLSKTDFYLVEHGQIVDSVKTGQDRPFSQRRFKISDSVFDFSQSPTESRELWIRASSDMLLYVPIAVYTAEEFPNVQAKHFTLLALLAGAFLGIMVYNCLLCLSLRERGYIPYTVYQAGVAFVGLVFGGFAHMNAPWLAEQPHLWAELTAGVMPIMCIAFAFFLIQFLDLKANQPTSFKIAKYAIAVCCVELCIVPFLPLMTAIRISSFLLVSACVFVEARLILRLQHGRTSYVFVAFLGIVFGPGTYFLTVCGWLPTMALTQHLIGIGTIVETLFLSLAMSSRISDLKEERATIIKTLKGDAPASELNSILGAGFGRNFSTSEMNVSIMFVDIVGFSQIADNLGPESVLQHLSRSLRGISDVVKEFHGTVDRSLGDGVLCFFGYESRMSLRHHANDAFSAARKIQEQIVANFQSDEHFSQFIMPVRIGIHTADVLIGDLGNLDRIDFTMVGSGVNFASRLETACSPFKVMVSEDCLKHLTVISADDPGFSEIHVAVKHQKSLTKAFEFNPFVLTQSQLARVEKLHMDQMHVRPSEARLEIKADRPISLKSEQGRFQVLDFSPHGFRVLGSTYIGQKATMLMEVETPDIRVNQNLRKSLLHCLNVEVRWSRPVAGGFEHGLKIYGLNPEQRQQVFTALRSMFRTNDLEPHFEVESLKAG